MIDELKKYKVSLIIISILVLLKFVVVPLLEWQNEEVIEIQLLEKQLNRINFVLNNESEIKQNNVGLKELLNDVKPFFYVSNDTTSFQLERQKWLEDVIVNHGLEIENVGWNPQFNTDSYVGHGHPIQLGISGSMLKQIQLIQFLQSQAEYIEIQSFNFMLNGKSKATLGRARLRITLTFYRRGQKT